VNLVPGQEGVEAARRAARQLQLSLAAEDRATQRMAAVRFASLPQLRNRSLDELCADPTLVNRAMARDVIARELGHVDWAQLLEAKIGDLLGVPMYVSAMSFSVNQWFIDYEEAAQALQQGGGYLLPYRKQFFVTSREAVAELGLDPGDPDWQRIGFDWIRPRDAEARVRLAARRYEVMLERGEPLP